MLSESQIEAVENFVEKECISYEFLREFCCSKIAEVNMISELLYNRNRR